MEVQKYSCMSCRYIGTETGKEYCQGCGADFPPPGPDGETISCKECGSGNYDDACPKCGAREEFGLLETDPTLRAHKGGQP